MFWCRQVYMLPGNQAFRCGGFLDTKLVVLLSFKVIPSFQNAKSCGRSCCLVLSSIGFMIKVPWCKAYRLPRSQVVKFLTVKYLGFQVSQIVFKHQVARLAGYHAVEFPSYIFTKFSGWPVDFTESLSRNVHQMSECLFVPLRKTGFPVDCRLLVEECIPNIGIPLDVSGFCCFNDFFLFLFSYSFLWGGVWVFATSLPCIMGELAAGVQKMDLCSNNYIGQIVFHWTVWA